MARKLKAQQTRKKPGPLLWCDLETTGLDASECDILEIVIYKADLLTPFVGEKLYSSVLRYFPTEARVDPLVLEMHGKNGLWNECMMSHHSRADVSTELSALIPEKAPEGEDKPILAGNSVHFDLGFLRWHFPVFARRLSHKVYDVSSVYLFAQSLGMPPLPKEEEAHRAEADVLSSIRLAKRVRDFFGRLPEASKS